MSIFATWLTIEDERQWIAELRAQGVGADVIRDGDPLPDDLDAPIIYQGSHVLPEESDARGGSVDVAAIPSHITRDGRDDRPEDAGPWPYLRLSIHADPRTSQQLDGTVILTHRQVARLHETLAEWLSSVRFDAEANR